MNQGNALNIMEVGFFSWVKLLKALHHSYPTQGGIVVIH